MVSIEYTTIESNEEATREYPYDPGHPVQLRGLHSDSSYRQSKEEAVQ
jgi:hypothetical protein